MTPIEDFETRFIPEPNSGCWLWLMGSNGAGYGAISVNGHVMLAHRRSWELYRSPIPHARLVLHKCDNPPCCNPDHLFLGTHADNMHDKCIKNRSGILIGESSASAKLFEHQARAIIDDPRPYSMISRDYDIGIGHVSAIKSGTTWKHLERPSHRERRQPIKGSSHSNAKLTEAQAMLILNDSRTQCKIAADFGVTQSAISLIKKRKNWKHL